MQANRCFSKSRRDRQEVRQALGDRRLLWLPSAVAEVKTSRTETEHTETAKKDSWPGGRTRCITAVFNKKPGSADLSGGNFSKHPAELEERWDRRAALIAAFLF